MTNIEKAFAISSAVTAYLRSKHGPGDLSWHPLFQDAKDLFAHLLEKKN
jgi:hypothetical protein